MPFTNLTLGDNWPRGEWPEHVDVMHEGAGDSLRYVPERTCTMDYCCEYDAECVADGKCSVCGEWQYHGVVDYCPHCGARVVD